MRNGIKRSRLLTVSGIGRNSGKTTCICHLLSAFSAKVPIYAIKISKHRHDVDPGSKLLYSGTSFDVYEETVAGTKDSQRYLSAGAARSFYVQGNEANLLPAWNYIMSQISEAGAVICETGSFAIQLPHAVRILVAAEPVAPETPNAKFADLQLSWQHSVTKYVALEGIYWSLC